MRCATAGVSFALVSVLCSAAPAFTQKTSTASAQSQANAARVADVYVQTHKGVYVYNASATGQLTPVKGSAFAETGQMAGIRGSYLITIGSDDIHDYALTSTGGVGSQVAEIDTQSYGGSECGTMDGFGSILDHTGKYFSVQLYGATHGSYPFYTCSAWQTYKIASNGQFTFLGDAENTSQYTYEYSALPLGISTYSSNDNFAYGKVISPDINLLTAFKRGMAGDLVEDSSFSETDPQPNPPVQGSVFAPVAVAADPSNHLAVVANTYATTGATQLASFTINNTTGAIQSTNTFENMPVVSSGDFEAAMSWAGNLVAVGGEYGFQLFHFNGAAPPTSDGGVLLPELEIDQLAWDKSNHLYALSYSAGELYVYTVTPTSTTEAPGSPYKIQDTYGLKGLIVVPRS
jgi:hypothetical protein